MFTMETLMRDLTLLQQRAIWRKLGYHSRQAAQEATPDDCLQLWVYTLLARLPILSSEQRELLFDELQPALVGWGTRCRELQTAPQDTGRAPPRLLLVFADGRYATWPGYVGWLDLQTGDNVPRPLVPSLETIAYDLSQLFVVNVGRCQQVAATAEKQEREHAVS